MNGLDDIPNPSAAKPDWWRLSARQRCDHLNALWAFTRTLVRTYRLPSPIVPPCWFRHDELVQELAALKDFRDEQCMQLNAVASLDFHAQLQLWINRMRFWVRESGCTGSEHIIKPPPMWVVPGTSAAMRAEADLDKLLDSMTKED